jgi:hypothetical protein
VTFEPQRMSELVMQDNERLSQAMRPSGFTGRVFGWLMTRSNKKAYRWAIDQLRPASPASYMPHYIFERAS